MKNIAVILADGCEEGETLTIVDILRRTEEAINSALSEVRQSRSNFRAASGTGHDQKRSFRTNNGFSLLIIHSVQ